MTMPTMLEQKDLTAFTKGSIALLQEVFVVGKCTILTLMAPHRLNKGDLTVTQMQLQLHIACIER